MQHTKPFIGRFQPASTRLPAKPQVDFAKGGSDFRCPSTTSSFGRQVLSYENYATSSRVKFAESARFGTSETVGPGPCALTPVSSLSRQRMSNKRNSESMHFGSSTRDGALKLYAIYTCKKN